MTADCQKTASCSEIRGFLSSPYCHTEKTKSNLSSPSLEICIEVWLISTFCSGCINPAVFLFCLSVMTVELVLGRVCDFFKVNGISSLFRPECVSSQILTVN